MYFEWPYYTLVNGKLFITTKRGMKEAFPVTNPPKFQNVAEAEDWLVANDFRGNVREAS